jgi:hypothetical protein
VIADFAEGTLVNWQPALIVAPGCNVGNRALPRATMTAVSQNLSIVLPLRAELWSAYQDTIAEAIIPRPIDQNWCAHWRNPMDMMRQG